MSSSKHPLKQIDLNSVRLFFFISEGGGAFKFRKHLTKQIFHSNLSKDPNDHLVF